MSTENTPTLRPLKPNDLDRVAEIDQRITGRGRKVFFEKRLEAALADTEGFIAVAIETDDILSGFAIARLQNGEFGVDHRVAVVDVIGVDPDSQSHGQGKLLLEGLTAQAKNRAIIELRTQVSWHDNDLIQFFANADFLLAPNQVLERSTARDI